MKKMAAGENTSTSGATHAAPEFRAKVTHMKNWNPASPPSNRDRLEVYALHKQAVSSDAPKTNPANKTLSPAEKAKLNAWRTKQGLSQSQAMNAYILEADRQLLVYGTSSGHTPKNTPEDDNTSAGRSGTSGSVLLTPRGLAAIPLLCAAASESRQSYLNRLNSTTNADNGWWMRQEPLCADPGSILALPEMAVLTIAAMIEKISLYLQLNEGARSILDTIALRPGVVQSLLWPLHNCLLIVWMLVIFLSTLTGSALVTLKTMALGSKRTGVSLENIFSQEVRPCRNGASSLTEMHQTTSVRFLGLALYPLGFLCRFCDGVAERIPMNAGAQLFVASAVYVSVSAMFWWYWFLVLPWISMVGIGLAFSSGWCFGLIELAGV